MEVKPGYKQTEVGVIPVEWEVFQLSEHFAIHAGGDVPKNSVSSFRSDSHPHPIFANALQNRGLYGFANEYRAKAGTLTVTARGYLGHAEFRSEPYFPIVRLLVLDPCGSLDAKFTTFAINERVRFAFESTGVPQLTAPQIGKYSVAAPPLPEQRAIAEALSDVDGLLGVLDRLITKKRDLKQAAMQQLLTGETRLPGFDGEWEVRRLGSVGAFLKGCGVKKDEAMSGDRPCVRYGEIYTHHHDVVREFNSFLSASVAAAATRLVKGDVLFAGSGETKAEIGKAVAFVHDCEAYAGGDIVILRPEASNALFLGYYLNSQEIQKQKASRGQGDAVVHISAASLASIVVNMPPLPEQSAIAAVLSDMDAELAVLEERREKTRLVKQGMMQELLTGRTRLV